MSLRSSIRTKPKLTMRDARLLRAQERVSKSARRAAKRMGPTAGQARQIASTRMTSARVWSAPRLDRAGHYFEHEVGPRVGTLLRRTAGRIQPRMPRRRRRGISAMLLVIGGLLGAVGTIAVRRNAARPIQEPIASADHLSAVSKNSASERAQTH